MLLELSVNDFALVDSLRMVLDRGFLVLTGETGAGKSLIMGALGVALGGRAEEDQIRRGAKEARIEARFDLAASRLDRAHLEDAGLPWPEDGELLVVREILPGGKSRARANDRAVTASALRRIGSRLVDLHGQHEHQWLLDPARQLSALDRYAGLFPEREALAAAHDAYRASRRTLEDLEISLRRAREEEELRRYQLKELRAANLQDGEAETLGMERERLRHAEAFRGSLEEAEATLYAGEGSAEDRIGAARRALERIAALDPRIDAVHEELLSVARVLADAAFEIRRARESLDADPGRLQEIEERLQFLHELRRKYAVGSEAELVERLRSLESDLERSEQGDALRAAARRDCVARAGTFLTAAARVSAARGEASRRFGREVMRELAEMAMSRAHFGIDIQRAPILESGKAIGDLSVDAVDPLAGLGPEGGDAIEFMLAANPGEASLPLRRVASGGELSRVMLGLKGILAEADEVDTLVFDEIDLGIGGDAARAVGEKMRRIGEARQVICITHLAQLAALGERHFHVEKVTSGGRTRVVTRELTGDERVVELARMLAGNEPSALALEHGREMLEAARRLTSRPARGRPAVRERPAPRRNGVKL